MATPDRFRRLALALPGAEEKGHMGHPDFRVGGKVFATLGYPDGDWGMVRLMPEQQADFMALAPGAFKPANGAWGRQGSTLVRLDAVAEDVLEHALRAAWRWRCA
ncbi:MAG: MmcQ/YjbR family DNA-binding protein [Alphaproteobacteria bacterium]|nr:MmcQ/YjbR family DNA-binding protein [Alphaproteobacteria bacterium]